MAMSFAKRKVFLVSSRGLTASTWFAKTLNRLEYVYCSHGRDRPERAFVTHELVNDESYRKDRLAFERWQRESSLSDYLSLLDDGAGPLHQTAFIGNIHGYILPELYDKVKAYQGSHEIKIANMIRNPVSLVHSYSALVHFNFLKYREKYDSEHLPRVHANRLIYARLGLGREPDVDIQGFVEGCQTVVKMSGDLLLDHTCPMIQMEKIVTDYQYYKKILTHLTGNYHRVERLKAADIMYQQKINSHQRNISELTAQQEKIFSEPRQIWQSWTSGKRKIFTTLVNEKTINQFVRHGYDFSFM